MSGKIIVTGVNGFIGKELCIRLQELGYSVIGLSSADGDISNPETISKVNPRDVEHVFHLAGKTFVPDSWKNPHNFFETNILGTSAVLDFCHKHALSMTYVSAYIYGTDIINPISETAIPSPNNPYALSKKIGEDLCKFYAQQFNLNVNIIRPFNVYGKNQGEHFLIPYILKQVRTSTEVRVKDLSPKRDYIYLSDVVECLISAMDYKKFGIFNAGTGKSYSVEEIIDFLLTIHNKKLPIISEQQLRINEISDTIADISLAEKELQWKPKIDIIAGLKML